MTSTPSREWETARAANWIGALVAGLGLAITAAYPASVLLRGDPPVGVPEPSDPLLILSSAVFGPLLAIWGSLAVQHGTLAPLTVRRALLVPASSLCTAAAGLAVFTYEWARLTPFKSPYPVGGPETIDRTLLEIVRMELSVAHVVPVAAASATVVGTAAVRRGWRVALASAALPASFTALALATLRLVDVSFEPPAHVVLLFVALLAVAPATVGYVAGVPSKRE